MCFRMNVWICFVAFLLSLVCNLSGIANFAMVGAIGSNGWNGRAYCSNGEHCDAYRQIVEENLPKGYDLYFCIGEDCSLDPVDRATHLALSWERSPVPVRYGDAAGAAGASAIVASRYLEKQFYGYVPVSINRSAVLWIKEEALDEVKDKCYIGHEVSPLCEFVGTGVICLLIVGFVWALTHGEVKLGLIPFVIASVFFCIVGGFSLTHTFFSPTGLGVYGGKARLFFLSGGIPSGFFVDAAYSSYQPAYPPILTLLTVLSYVVSGGCGEWITQLLEVFAASMVFCVSLATVWPGRIASVFLVSALFLSELSFVVSSLYYAEPLMALLAVIGFIKVSERPDDWCGWIVMGASGLVKVEGVVIFGAMSFAILICNLIRVGGAMSKWHVLFSIGSRAAVAAIVPIAWFAAVGCAGASFYDYALDSVDIGKFLDAFAYMLYCAFVDAWQYAFIYPLMAIALIQGVVHKKRLPSRLIVAFVFVPLCLLGFASIYSLSTANDFEWLLKTSADRLLWTPGILLAICLLRGNRVRAESGIPCAN